MTESVKVFDGLINPWLIWGGENRTDTTAFETAYNLWVNTSSADWLRVTTDAYRTGSQCLSINTSYTPFYTPKTYTYDIPTTHRTGVIECVAYWKWDGNDDVDTKFSIQLYQDADNYVYFEIYPRHSTTDRYSITVITNNNGVAGGVNVHVSKTQDTSMWRGIKIEWDTVNETLVCYDDDDASGTWVSRFTDDWDQTTPTQLFLGHLIIFH